MNLKIDNAIVILVLGINGFLDWKKREISLALTGCLAVYGMIQIPDNRSGRGVLLRIVLLLVLIGASLGSKGKLGFGDALQMSALSFVLPPWELARTAFLGFFSCTCVGMLILLRKGKKHMELPFVPFLLAGYLGGMLWD